MNLYHIGVISALIAFALASLLSLHSFATQRTRYIINKTAYVFFVLGTCLMTSNTISAFYLDLNHLTSGFALITSLGWITILAQLFFQVRILSTIVAPLSTLILLVQLFFGAPHGAIPGAASSSGTLLAVHILSSVLGEAFAIIAFGIAVFYLMQQQALKKKQLNRLQHTQISISKLSQALIISIWLGFSLLTSGLIMGAVYWQFYFDGDRDTLLGKILWAFMVWFWYLATLISRNIFNISAKRLAWMTIAGFVLLAIGLFGLSNWS